MPIGCGLASFIVSSASLTEKSVVWVVDWCAWMLPLVRNGHVSGNLVVCICRLRATSIELPSHTPLHYLPLWSLSPWGAIGILRCVPKWTEFLMCCHFCPSRAHRGCVVDLSCALCPECAAQFFETTSVHWCMIVLLDAEYYVSVGLRPLSLDAYAFCRMTRTMLALFWPPHIAYAMCRGPCSADVAKECYLVDPASSHMLVSKIKPCMCKYELIQTVKLRMAH